MPEYLAPGVYVEEVERGSKSIEGVSTSTAGFLGETERGPTKPKLLTSFSDYRRAFGGYHDSSYLAHAVNGFFTNGGSRCYVGRVTAAQDTARATLTDADDNDVLTLEAVGPGEWGTTVAAIVEPATLYKEGENDLFKLTLRYWPSDRDTVEDPAAPDPDTQPAVEEVYDNLSPVEGASNYYGTELNSSVLVTVAPSGEGRPEPETTWLNGTSTDGGTASESASAGADTGADADDESTDEGDSEIPPPDELSEMTKDELQDIAEDVDVAKSQTKAELIEELGERRDEDLRTDGGTAALSLADYRGTDTAGERTGLAAFKELDDISIVCIPDENDVDGLTDDVVAHCENMGDRFAILQSPQDPGDVSEMVPPVDSKYAAYYYPWVEVVHPETSARELVPPGGHIAGIYARSDGEQGVHKAPANEVVRGAQRQQFNLTKGEQDVLNPKGVNCIRSFQGRGIRLWGARTTSSDPSWKYINVRRLFLYVEQSIDHGTQWVVFEPNDQDLWARVRQTVENFLTTVYRDGALMGSSPDEAFYVNCDRSTMTQDDIDNGRLVVEIGIAPVKPAEFVIFRIGQWTANAG